MDWVCLGTNPKTRPVDLFFRMLKMFKPEERVAFSSKVWNGKCSTHGEGGVEGRDGRKNQGAFPHLD